MFSKRLVRDTPEAQRQSQQRGRERGWGEQKHTVGKRRRRPGWRAEGGDSSTAADTSKKRREKTCKLSYTYTRTRGSHLHLVPSPTYSYEYSYRFTAFCTHSVRKYRARMNIQTKARTHPIFPNREEYVQNPTFTRTGGNLAGKISVCCSPKIEIGPSDQAGPDAQGEQRRCQLPSLPKKPEIRVQTKLIRVLDFEVFRGFNQPSATV